MVASKKTSSGRRRPSCAECTANAIVKLLVISTVVLIAPSSTSR